MFAKLGISPTISLSVVYFAPFSTYMLFFYRIVHTVSVVILKLQSKIIIEWMNQHLGCIFRTEMNLKRSFRIWLEEIDKRTYKNGWIDSWKAWFCYFLNTVHSLAQFLLFFYQWTVSIEFGIIFRRLFLFFPLFLYLKYNSFICVCLNLNNYWQDMKISRVPFFFKKNIAPIFLLHFFCYLVFLSRSLCNLNSIHLISFDYFKLVNGSEITCLRIIFFSYFIFVSFSLPRVCLCVSTKSILYFLHL